MEPLADAIAQRYDCFDVEAQVEHHQKRAVSRVTWINREDAGQWQARSDFPSDWSDMASPNEAPQEEEVEHVKFEDNRVQTVVAYSPSGYPITANLPSIGMEEGGEPLPGVFFRTVYSEQEPPPPPPEVTQIPMAATPAAEPRQQPQLVYPPVPAPIIPNEKLVIMECLQNPDKIKELEDKGEPGKALMARIKAMPEWAQACNLQQFFRQQEDEIRRVQVVMPTGWWEEDTPPRPLTGLSIIGTSSSSSSRPTPHRAA